MMHCTLQFAGWSVGIAALVDGRSQQVLAASAIPLSFESLLVAAALQTAAGFGGIRGSTRDRGCRMFAGGLSLRCCGHRRLIRGGRDWGLETGC